MATDYTVPTFGAADILALGADWTAQDSSDAYAYQRAIATGSNGDTIGETSYGAIRTGSNKFIYVGAETDFVAAINAGPFPGSIQTLIAPATLAVMILSVNVDYSGCAKGERPQVTFSFRDGPTAASRVYHASGIGPVLSHTAPVLPTYVSAAPVVPSIFTFAGKGTAEVTNASYMIKCDHGQSNNASGNYLAGDNSNGEETVTLAWVGNPAVPTPTGWILTAKPGLGNRTNTGYGDGNQIVFTRGVKAYVAP